MSVVAPMLELRGVRFAYAGQSQAVLDLQELRIDAGERVFLRGPSGSGKSTLLALIAGVLPMQAGSIKLLGQELAKLSASKRDSLRANHLGLVFQQFNLLPYLTVRQNILLGCGFATARAQRAIAAHGSEQGAADVLIQALGISAQAQQRADQLSVGQQQRVAVARALIGGPELLICDEPTSALDADARSDFMRLLMQQCHQQKATLLFVSHDASLASQFDRSIDLSAINALRGAA